MTHSQNSQVVQRYLALLDKQREHVIGVVSGIPPELIWQRPALKEWCIGEILNHTVMLYRSFFPFVGFAWRYFRWTASIFKDRAYRTDLEDPYRKSTFPHWAGFLWKPKYTPDNPVSLAVLTAEIREMHQFVRAFYDGKDEQKLGNVFLFDPLFGFLNLILVLRIGIYHDQLHYEDVITLAADLVG